MARVNAVTPDKADQEVKEIYGQLEKKMGKVFNIFLNMGNSPAVLKSFIALDEAVNQTSLNPKLREQIALVVAQTNQCNYCLSAHTAISKGKGLADQEIIQARHGQAKDPKSQAILKFAKSVVDKKGKVNNQDIASLKAAGINDKELVDIILVIIINIFTNYFNNITDPQIDFALAPEIN
jgi:uncharacterized peroxidase-related enzyme